MASLETAVRDTILAGTAVAALVGTRVRPLDAGPADALPYATYQISGRGSLTTLSDGPADYQRGAFEVNAYAATYSGCMALANAIRAHLDDLSTTEADVELDVTYEDETDVEEAPSDGDMVPVFYGKKLVFSTLHRSIV